MYVYKVTNTVNSRVYVGLTVCSLEKRWREHKSAANTGVNKPLYCAMRKHGIDNFAIHLVYTATDFEDLRAAELRFIKELNAHVLDGGYNLTDHGVRYGAPNSAKGEAQHQSKMTEAMVAFIRNPEHWNISNAQLLSMVEQKFAADLSRDTVRDARRGSSWKHLNDKYPPVKAGQGTRKPPMTEERKAEVTILLAEHHKEAVKKSADMRRGKRGGNAKLSEDIVRQIFYSTESLNKTAKQFGVSKTSVMHIKQRKAHEYLTKEL